MLILPAAHLVLCAAGFFMRGEYALWFWLIPALVDRPVSDLVFKLNLGLYALVALGTVWWFFVNVILYWILRTVYQRIYLN